MIEQVKIDEYPLRLAESWSRAAIAALVEHVVGDKIAAMPPLGIVLDVEPAPTLRIAGDHGVANLLDGLPDDGYAIISGDDPRAARLAAHTAAHVLRVGRGSGCEVRAENIESQPNRLKFSCDGVEFELPLTGRHAVAWALAAIATGRVCCLDMKLIAAKLATAQLPAGYCDVTRQGEATIVNNTAGGTLTAFRAAADVLRTLGASRRVVLCGERVDQELHPALARTIGQEMVTRCGADLLVVCGEQRQAIVAGARSAGLAESNIVIAAGLGEAMELVAKHTRPGDAIVIDQGRAVATADLWRTTNTKRRAA